MIPVLLQNEAFTLDESTISSGVISEKELMDDAGKAIAQFIVENIKDPFNQEYIVMAGPGNNGGDAIISHYYLLDYGINSDGGIWLMNHGTSALATQLVPVMC